MSVEPANTARIAIPTEGGGGNLAAIIYMMVAVLGLSVMPPVVSLAGGGENPFLVSAGLRIGLILGYAVFLSVGYWSILRSPSLWKLVSQRVVSWIMVFAVLAYGDLAFFGLATRYIDISLASVIYETWPIVTILLMQRLLSDSGRYRKITPAVVGLMLVGLLGFALAVGGQSGGFRALVTFDASSLETLLGVFLAVLAVVLGSFSAFGYRWGEDLKKELPPSLIGRKSPGSIDLFCVVAGTLLANCIAVPVNLTAGFATGEEAGLSMFSISIIGGVFAYAAAGVAWRKANLVSNNLGVNALVYLVPMFSLVWLFALSQAHIKLVDYLIMGAAAIITANLLINFEAEIRSGFKALILALGTCGAIVYLRDDFFEFLGVEQWIWAGSGYFESLTLSATVFTLLLAFRVARLVSRTSEEDNRTFIIYRKLDMLARRGMIDGDVCEYILQVDRFTAPAAIEEAYWNARQYILAVEPEPLDEADRQLLSDAETNLDALVRSKQVDIHLGEVFALGIFAAVTVGLSLLSLPPNVEGWSRPLVDLFAMIISSVVIFLLFHIYDLQRERNDYKLVLPGWRGGLFRHYTVRFTDTAQRSFDQWLSVIVGLSIVLTYASLLAHKWLGWFS